MIPNVNDVHAEQMTTGEKVADQVASTIGSWRFIIIQSVIVVIWIIGNLWILTHPFDIFPFILLNLLFSTQAAYSSPLIMMSQNRQAVKDRLMAEHDYQTNLAAKLEIEQILTHLSEQDTFILQMMEQLKENTELTRIRRRTRPSKKHSHDNDDRPLPIR